MATQTQTQTKANEILNCGLTPVLLGRVGDALKIPQLTGWQNAEYTAAEIARWPAANNIGIRCGLTLRGQWLSVFDFDKYADGIFPAWLDNAIEIIPYPVIIKTGKGYHVPVITEKPQEHGIIAGEPVQDGNGRDRTDVIIEIRGKGQQVVSHGSKHPSGGQYKIIAGESLANIPHISGDQYQQLVEPMRKHDKRTTTTKPKKKYDPAKAGTLTGFNCLDYAREYIAGDEQIEHDGQIRILGNGGLIITEDGHAWHNFAEGRGGNVVGLISWHQDITMADAAAQVRDANSTAGETETEPEPAVSPITETDEPTLNHAFMLAYDNKELSTGGDLARSAWGGDAVMVAPSLEQFTGDYPKSPAHTCRHYMKAEAGADDLLKHKRYTSRLWRGRNIDGFKMEACAGCRHDYAWRTAQQIEYEAGAYSVEDMPFRYQILKPGQVHKRLKIARQWDGAGFELRYWLRPLQGGARRFSA